jgi:hypothetical protein
MFERGDARIPENKSYRKLLSERKVCGQRSIKTVAIISLTSDVSHWNVIFFDLHCKSAFKTSAHLSHTFKLIQLKDSDIIIIIIIIKKLKN